MTNIAIIPARGGSKRIPRKNIRDFCGKPIIAYSIEAALSSEIFEEVMVSTDDEEIAGIARKYGASVPFMRSRDNSDDHATTADVLIEVLEQYEIWDRNFDIMCCIYPTAPFVTSGKLNKAYDLLIMNDAPEVMPVVAFSYPPQRAVVKEDGMEMLKYVFPNYYEYRSQDLEKWYHDVGQFYFYDVNKFKKSKGRILNGILPYILSEIEVQDIDNEDDWKLAEMKFRLLDCLEESRKRE